MQQLSCCVLVKMKGLPAVQKWKLLHTLTTGKDLDAMLRTDARTCGRLPCALLVPFLA